MYSNFFCKTAFACFIAPVLSTGQVPDVGVCWTRNMVTWTDTAPHYGIDSTQWQQLRVSATSLRSIDADVGTCLFTEAPAKVVHSVMSSATLFDMILPATDGGSILHQHFGNGIMQRIDSQPRDSRAYSRRSRNLSTLIVSRIGKISHLGRGPFAITLFVDDDTSFCGQKGALINFLRTSAHGAELVTQPDVRMVPRYVYRSPDPDNADHAGAQRLIGNCLRGEKFSKSSRGKPCADSHWASGDCVHHVVACADRICMDSKKAHSMYGCADKMCKNMSDAYSAFQSAAILVSRSSHATQFATDWVNMYLALWVNGSGVADNFRYREHIGKAQSGYIGINEIRQSRAGMDQIPLQALLGSGRQLSCPIEAGHNDARVTHDEKRYAWTIAPLYVGMNNFVGRTHGHLGGTQMIHGAKNSRSWVSCPKE